MLFLADAGHANCKKIKGTRRQSSYMPPRNYTVLGHRQFRSRKAAALNKATALWMRANAATARRLFSFAVVRQLDNRLFLFLKIIIKSKCHINIRAAPIFDRITGWIVTKLGHFKKNTADSREWPSTVLLEYFKRFIQFPAISPQ